MNNKELKPFFYFSLLVVPVLLSTNTEMDVSGVGKECATFHYRKTPYIAYLTNYSALKGKMSRDRLRLLICDFEIH